MRPESIAAVIVPLLLFGSFWAFLIVNSVMKSRVRELEIRERIAMIEKGLVPPPEVDPRGFDRAMARYDRRNEPRRGTAHRHRRAGITLMGIGLGLMVMIAFAGDSPKGAVGVGGCIVVLGMAFLINSLFEPPDELATASGGNQSPPATPSTSDRPPAL